MIIPKKDNTKSYVMEFLVDQLIPDKILEDISSFTGKHFMLDVSLIFGMPSIIVKCSINEAKGSLCTSLCEILQNSYACHKSLCHENKNMQPYHDNRLEFPCSSADSKNNKIKVGCLVCNKSVLCHHVKDYGTMKAALVETMMPVAIVHHHSFCIFIVGRASY